MKKKCVCFVFYTTVHCMLAPNGEPLLTAVFVGTLGKASARGGGGGGGSKTMLTRKDCSVAFIFFSSCFGNIYTNYLSCCSKGIKMTKFKEK